MKTLNIIKASTCLAAVAGLFHAAPILAQDAPEAREPSLVLTPTSDWKITKKSDRCRLSRNFGEGDNVTRMIMEKGGGEPTFNLTLIGRPVANPIGQLVSLQFGPDEKTIGRNYIPVKARSGRSAIVMYGAGFAPSILRDDGEISADRVGAKRLAAIDYLQVERAGLASFRLDTGSLVEAMASLSECGMELSMAFAGARSGQTKRPNPIGNRSEWVQSRDYPPIMLGYRQGGNIGYRLTVNKQGKPTFCIIRNTTVPQMFDDAVCLALLKRARFEPALDLEGEPMYSYYSGTVRFMVR